MIVHLGSSGKRAQGNWTLLQACMAGAPFNFRFSALQRLTIQLSSRGQQGTRGYCCKAAMQQQG